VELLDGHLAFVSGLADCGICYIQFQRRQLQAALGDSLLELGQGKAHAGDLAALHLAVRTNRLDLLVPERHIPWPRALEIRLVYLRAQKRLQLALLVGISPQQQRHDCADCKAV